MGRQARGRSSLGPWQTCSRQPSSSTHSFTSLDCQFYPDTPFYCFHIKVFSWTFLLIALRRFTHRAQDAMDAGIESAQKAATSAVADAAAREVEKQISAGFGQLMGK